MNVHDDRAAPPTPEECRCRICEPEPLDDDQERTCVRIVAEHGWQVMLVAEGDEDEPAFAYTVGLGHRLRHPELVISGLPSDLMHRVLNALVQRIDAGRRLDRPGLLIEGALGRAALVVEGMTEEGLRQTVTWSGWFHRRRPDAVQLVWPTTSGVFDWQTGAPAVVARRQPRAWRTPGPRVGVLAVDPPWAMPTGPDTLVFVCRHVVDDGEPVLFAARESAPDRGEDWSFQCGAEEHDTSSITLWHLRHVIAAAPSVAVELSDLGLDRTATRRTPDEEWTVSGPA